MTLRSSASARFERPVWNWGPGKTVQSSAEEADINTIVRRFGLTGQLPQNVRVPLQGDFTGAYDFHSAMQAIRQAEESFAAMPADVRKRFHNDAGEFTDFATELSADGKVLANLDELRKLGLAVPAKAPEKAPEPLLVKMAPEVAK